MPKSRQPRPPEYLGVTDDGRYCTRGRLYSSGTRCRTPEDLMKSWQAHWPAITRMVLADSAEGRKVLIFRWTSHPEPAR
jgi:hypothetical protein